MLNQSKSLIKKGSVGDLKINKDFFNRIKFKAEEPRLLLDDQPYSYYCMLLLHDN